MLITIRNGKAELRNDNGSLVRTMGSSNVVSVSMNSNQELVGIVYASGKGRNSPHQRSSASYARA